MKNLVLRRKNDYTSIAQQDSGRIGILASLNKLDISEVIVHQDKTFLILPSENGMLSEFFYLLEGELVEKASQTHIYPGDSFNVNDLEEPIHCYAEKECKILYITNGQVANEMSHSMKNLHEMITELEKKDQYTKSHSVRVIEWVPIMAEKMNLSTHQLNILMDAALFHDLGKIEIADEILHKPSSLSDLEYKRIKDHPSIGRIIADNHQLTEVGKVIEQHHERIDGSGYPKGLTGDEIRIEAKIIAVIDSYDAMTSDRPYRKGLSKEKAIIELKRCSGSHYDPHIVNTFIEILEKN